MASAFDDLDAALSEAVLAAFGETVAGTLRPWTRSEYTDGVDSSRAVRSVRGVFSESHGVEQLRGAAMSSEHRGVTRVSVQMAEFFVPASEVSALPYAIRQGDKLELAGRGTYAVSDIQRADTGDLNLILVTGE